MRIQNTSCIQFENKSHELKFLFTQKYIYWICLLEKS